MEKTSGGSIGRDKSSIDEDINDFSMTFCDQPEESSLRVWTLSRNNVEVSGVPLAPSKWYERSCLEGDPSHLALSLDLCQIFYVGQRNSYSRLRITRDLFQEFVQAYLVFPRIWDFLLPFSFKIQESNIGHAPFRFRRESLSRTKTSSFECAYSFSYVKLNGRAGLMKDNPDYDPWSIRHIAVYQQYQSSRDRLTFLIIAPSVEIQKSLEEEILRIRSDGRELNPFNLHQVIMATLHDNWRLYIRSLERKLAKQSEQVTLAQIQSDTELLSPLTNFAVNFVDRQRLKMTEEKILDLVVIFESLYDTTTKLHLHCQSQCMGFECSDCCCSAIVEALEDQKNDIQLNLKKVEVLYKRAQSAAALLSDLLEYENAQIGHLNEKSLNGLVMETKDENAKMMILTERSTQDAAAVKLLTVITLIYLPMTVVASLFSSQLVRVNESGQVSIVSGAWWFAVVTIPLTLATLVAWKCWLSHTMKNYGGNSIVTPGLSSPEKVRADRPSESYILLKVWRTVGRFVWNLRHRARGPNPEGCQAV